MMYCRTYGGMEKTRKIESIPEHLMTPPKKTRKRQDIIIIIHNIFVHFHPSFRPEALGGGERGLGDTPVIQYWAVIPYTPSLLLSCNT